MKRTAPPTLASRVWTVPATALGLLLLVGCNGAGNPLPGTTGLTPADLGPDHHIQYASDEIEWEDGPASLEEGAEMAVLEGDPGAEGIFTMRLRMPDGFRIAPHSHPNFERVTVISGTFRLGHGETFDREATDVLEPGSYTTMPPGMRHFAVMEGETVIQLTSVGPWEINYVNPADDPRDR